MGEALTDRGLLRTARLGIRLLKEAADAETPDTVPIAPKRRPPLSITSHCPHQGLTTYAAAGTHSKVHEHAPARTHGPAYTRTGTHSRTHAQARTRVHTHRHARTHSRTHAHAYTRTGTHANILKTAPACTRTRRSQVLPR